MTAALMLVFGLSACFLGERIVRMLAFAGGAAAGYLLTRGPILEAGLEGAAGIAAGAACALLLGWLCVLSLRLSTALAGAASAWLAAGSFTDSAAAAAVAAVVAGAACLLLSRHIIAIVTAAGGAAAAVPAACAIAGLEPGGVLLLAATAALFLAGAAVQLRSLAGRK